MDKSMEQVRYVAYYRVSTTKQGASGLGLESQRMIVGEFVSRRGGVLLGEYVEVRSGGSRRRVEIHRAISRAKAEKAVLVCANLSRLARDVGFICAVRDGGCRFVFCDMPDANELTVNVVASVAEDYRKQVSTNTRNALLARKARGLPVGNHLNFSDDGRRRGALANRERALSDPVNVRARAMAVVLRERGMTLRGIAAALGDGGFLTPRGCCFTAAGVKRLLEKF